MSAILSDFLFCEHQADYGIEVEVLGKPLIAHILDQFVGSTHREIHLITAKPSELRAIIGNGAYWSLTCHIHGVAHAAQARRIARSIAFEQQEELVHMGASLRIAVHAAHEQQLDCQLKYELSSCGGSIAGLNVAGPLSISTL